MTTAAEDDALRGAPLRVYVWLSCKLLDPLEYRPVKVTGLAALLKIDKDTASKALGVLVERGYLDRRYVARRGYEYRFYHTRRAAA